MLSASVTSSIMPPRLHVCLRCRRAALPATGLAALNRSARHASAQAVAPAPTHEQMTQSHAPVLIRSQTQPPSHKQPSDRRSQLHRQYTSLLRSTPMMILLQHNNLLATEWMALRRELFIALQKVDKARAAAGYAQDTDLASAIRIQILQSGVFGAALRVVEFYRPEAPSVIQPDDPKINSSLPVLDASHSANDGAYRHSLSRDAWRAVVNRKHDLDLAPLLSGPLAAVTFPSVSPEHLKAVLSILSPQAPTFPAPARKANPGYWEPAVQSAVQKLLLLGGRVEGKVFDMDRTRTLGAIEGGLEGLRAQLVAMLQGLGASITGTLETAGRSLYFTIDGRKEMLEKEEKGIVERKQEGGGGAGTASA